LKTIKKDFVNESRPFIEIHGYHVKCPYRGVLFLAMGLDANNKLYLIVYVIVDAENNNIW
jgi:hypothetical protein